MSTMPSHATTAEHLALAPPKSGHWGLPAGMAVGVHALLAAALAWGVNWRHEPQLTAVSAELWSRLPQEAAPLPVTPPPPPPKPEESSPTPPPPAPQPKAQAQENADIALRQREKAKREREEALRLEQERKETIAKEKAAKEKAAQAAKDKAKAEEARKQAEQKKQQLAQQKADADKKQREEAARKERADAKQAEARKKAEQAALDKNRDEQIKRQMAQLGGASGSGGSGQAAQSSGPSAGYGAKVAARIRPNIRFDDDLPGNPLVEVRVRTAPDGAIVSRTVHKTSGHPAWDQAALRAIDRTGSLPRDTDGRVPSDLIIELRPKEQ
jgi:colicin import membrane protein